MSTFTKEQKEEFDKIKGPGLYTVLGDGGYQYLCERVKWMVLDMGNPHTILVIGNEDDRTAFFKQMFDMGVIDFPVIEPWFFSYNDYVPDGEAEDEYYARSTGSEVDTQKFCDFIRHAPTNSYYPVGAVVILYEDCGGEHDQKYLNQLFKIPVWKGSTLEKNIELPVFNVSRAEWNEFSKASNSTPPSGLKRTIELDWGHEMVPTSVEWMVPEFIPLHQATAFSGEMDTRKSTLALDIAARGSRVDQPWFMHKEIEMLDGWPVARRPFITLFAGAEDDYASTVLPRFIAAGGQRDCLACLKLDVKNEKKTNDGLQVYSTPLSFDEHVELLADTIKEINKSREWKVGLLINDPIISFFGNKSYNNPQDARDIMLKLKKLCEEMPLTIINICHFNKTPGLTAKQKTAGSKALIEAHRQAWAFDLMEDDPKTTIIAPIKHNLLKDARSYKITTDSKEIEWSLGEGYFQKSEVGVVRFVGYSEMSADDRIDEKEDKGRGNRKELKKAILDALKGGPMPAGQVKNALQDMNASPSSVDRAAKELETAGKLRRSGTNRNNMVWQLATEAEQAQIFDGVSNE